MTKSGITAIITCYNEASMIEQAIQSLLWANEVIVVDSFSTDNTVKLIKKYTEVTLLQHKYETPAKQKNWVIPQAKYPWIFLIDADEIPTQALVEEIKNTVSSNNVKDSYWIYRQNYFMGKKLNFTWKNDKVIRLFKRDKCRYEDVYVHEEIEHEGKDVGFLHNKLLHYSFKSKAHYYDKIKRYADWQANDYSQKTSTITLFHLWLKPAFRFLKHYIFQGGFLDGKVGFFISKTMAWGVYLRYAKLKSLKKGNFVGGQSNKQEL